MRRRKLVLISVTAMVFLAGGAVLLGADAAEPSEEAVRECIAEFLEIEPDAIEAMWGRTMDRHGTTDGWARSEDGTRLTYGIREIAGKLVVVQMVRRIERTDEDIGLDRARAKALAFAESKYRRWGPDMVQTEGKRTPSGPYMFHWKRFTDEAYETGDFVWLQLESGSGRVFSYVVHYATHDTPPRIDAEEASRIALEQLEEQVGEGAAIEVTETRCVLSMPWSEGPMWFIQFAVLREPILKELGPSRRFTTVRVDGLTGDVLTRADMR